MEMNQERRRLLKKLKYNLTINERIGLSHVYKTIQEKYGSVQEHTFYSLTVSEMTKEKKMQRTSVSNGLRILDVTNVICKMSIGCRGSAIKILDLEMFKELCDDLPIEL